MSGEHEEYLAVLKASYDYLPQSEDEIEIKEDQILLLIEKTDDDWWKVKAKGEADGPTGLVPSAYVEPAEHSTLVKAQYDYDAAAQGELSVKEDQTLLAFGKEDDGWLLVQTEEGGKVGYVPANYVEEATEGGSPDPAPAAASRIVIPDSPPRPVSVYTDPADLVAASAPASKAKADDIKTWSIAEIDKKGKKKKGTLGIGNGAIFFASESDKTPVQKWQTGDISSAKIDKTKHVLIDVGGSTPISLHFNAGSKETADAILAKLESSRGIAQGNAAPEAESSPQGRSLPPPLRGDQDGSNSPSKKGVTVHFSEASPAIIPPRAPSEAGDEEVVEANGHTSDTPAHTEEAEGEEAVALYDFQAQGEDELTVLEGEQLWIIEKDGDEWWKCRNMKGDEGVVPASYIEPTGAGRLPTPKSRANPEREKEAEEEEEEEEEDDTAEREEEERARAARDARLTMEAEQLQRAKAAAAAAEAEKKRREKQKEKEAKERERREREAKQKEREEEAASAPTRSTASRSGKKSSSESRKSTEKRAPPAQDQTRVWHDRTGQFRVEAAFLGYKNGMIRLHKVNGVVIEVPSEKMSVEDMAVVQKLTGSADRRNDDDDDSVPLAIRRKSLATPPRSGAGTPQKKSPPIDWFEFFLNAGCDVDDCTRYASSFERDKMDEAILPDITEGTLRSLGLREGDIIRVTKAIDQRRPKVPSKQSEDQLLRDDDEAPKSKTPSPGPPNLFAAGPGGALKTQTRRGRPQPTKSVPAPGSVDLSAISTASEQIQRTTTPLVSSPSRLTASSPVQAPPRASSAVPASGFDDDAWTPRPSSTKPAAPTPPAVEPRAPSAPPAPVAAPAPAPPPVSVQPSAQSTGTNLAKTTESDIFDQLARLSQLRVQSPAVQSAPPSSIAPSPSIRSPPPASYNAGLGVGSSPVPIGQHLQAQQTGFLPPPQPAANGPRGPFAPVPANQGLLQPLIPTTTGFTGFVPTRLSNASPFQNPPQQQFQSQPQQQFQNPPQQQFQQQPSFLTAQPTGFPGQQILPQQTGFPTSGPLLSQPTGFAGGQFNGYGAQAPPPVPSFQNSNFGQLQPTPTGFNPGFGQPPSLLSNGINTGPPVVTPPKDTTPAGIFAQMKAGTFGNDAAPQPQNKYDALRTTPTSLTAQPTGWGYPGFPGGYNVNGY
ncbi:hypothetical protein BV25DRAFT_1913175 [Artomyces pyxidatus]|uniref:Uncharacterized protein n=1 Tax=Artomyces pyxidatus TaxID=48021 RepID=A0ACB8TA99_9AGAM|nr:hypothetical protein BV25DRAFT_1913175 [Artomyces pyxidatus]